MPDLTQTTFNLQDLESIQAAWAEEKGQIEQICFHHQNPRLLGCIEGFQPLDPKLVTFLVAEVFTYKQQCEEWMKEAEYHRSYFDRKSCDYDDLEQLNDKVTSSMKRIADIVANAESLQDRGHPLTAQDILIALKGVTRPATWVQHKL